MTLLHISLRKYSIRIELPHPPPFTSIDLSAFLQCALSFLLFLWINWHCFSLSPEWLLEPQTPFLAASSGISCSHYLPSLRGLALTGSHAGKWCAGGRSGNASEHTCFTTLSSSTTPPRFTSHSLEAVSIRFLSCHSWIHAYQGHHNL